MTAKAGFYGRDDREYQQPLVPNSGEQYFTQVNKTTGEIEVWNEELISDKRVGTLKNGNFEPNNNWWGGASREERKFFQSDAGKKKIRELAEDNIIRDLTNPDLTDPVQTPAAARKNANQFLKNQKMDTPPDATSGEVAQANLNNTVIKPVAGTRNKAGSFGDLKYPKDMNGSQDFMMFTLLEYKPKDLLSGDSLGTGERARVGFNKDGGGRKILGTCSLPIQSGIKDTNSADWGENKMNAMQLIAAEAALAGTEGPEQAGKALDKIANVMGENSGVAKEAIQQYFAGKMTGSTGLFARTKGATINPNLELLFNGPTLRPFSFQFKLSPRNKLEAQEVVRIIRFFKQGMSPIRTEGNLFLLAPHTFQVHFVHAPTSAEHPFIGKMKECALKTFSTDYTPENNYSTLKDGFMASYSITMEFQELEPVYNDDYRDDEDSGFSSFREDPAENAALQNTLPAKIGF